MIESTDGADNRQASSEAKPGRAKPKLLGCAAVTLASIFAASAFLLWAVLGFPTSLRPQRGEVYETKELHLAESEVRVRAFHEKTNWIPGGIFVLESLPRGSTQWNEIASDRHDDPGPIPDIVKKDDHLLYLSLFQKLVATYDGGRSWIIWDLMKDLDQEHIKREYLYLIGATLDKGGKGSLKVHCFLEEKTLILRTDDGGRSWKPDGYRPGYYPPGPSDED